MKAIFLVQILFLGLIVFLYMKMLISQFFELFIVFVENLDFMGNCSFKTVLCFVNLDSENTNLVTNLNILIILKIWAILLISSWYLVWPVVVEVVRRERQSEAK